MFFEQMHPLWQSYLADQRELLDLIEKQVLPSTELVPPASLVMQVFRADQPGRKDRSRLKMYSKN